MISKLNDSIIPLIEWLREYAPEDCTSVNIFINATGVEVTTRHKTLDDLKIDGISMRNLKGEWITCKEIKTPKNK